MTDHVTSWLCKSILKIESENGKEKEKVLVLQFITLLFNWNALLELSYKL